MTETNETIDSRCGDAHLSEESVQPYSSERTNLVRKVKNYDNCKKIVLGLCAAYTLGTAAYIGNSYLKYKSHETLLPNMGVEFSQETEKDMLMLKGGIYGILCLLMGVYSTKLCLNLQMQKKFSESDLRKLDEDMNFKQTEG